MRPTQPERFTPQAREMSRLRRTVLQVDFASWMRCSPIRLGTHSLQYIGIVDPIRKQKSPLCNKTLDCLEPQYTLHVKRALDLVGSITLIIIFLPLLMYIAVLLKSTERGSFLFVQIRIGKNGRRFRCLKFRTMIVDAEEALRAYLLQCPNARREWIETQKLRDDPRVTALGRFLRKCSLDELPQLFNVLMGEMSLVGPRPITEEEIPRYADKIRGYMAVRPGLTGLWQISGRSNCTYEERVALDAQYVSEWKLRNDIMILLRTVPAWLRQDGSC